MKEVIQCSDGRCFDERDEAVAYEEYLTRINDVDGYIQALEDSGATKIFVGNVKRTLANYIWYEQSGELILPKVRAKKEPGPEQIDSTEGSGEDPQAAEQSEDKQPARPREKKSIEKESASVAESITA